MKILKQKLENSNFISCFLLNKMFYVTLFVWIFLALLVIIWNSIQWPNPEIFNAITGVFISFLSLAVAYYWGNFASLKREKNERIRFYIKDIKITQKNLQKNY
ncbi:MAG: hypothetical protein REH79_03420 [Spiroplasma sp.]|nr:hypothetical protein [Spiroplasma sp.]